MEIEYRRIIHHDLCTISHVLVDGKHFGFGLEDPSQLTKIRGNTRIPAARYEVKYRETPQPSPKTAQYRAKHSWFTNHLWLQNVKNFQYVYMHKGNNHKHTDGCLLIGTDLMQNDKYGFVIGRSTDAFHELYQMAQQEFEIGKKVFVTIKDI